MFILSSQQVTDRHGSITNKYSDRARWRGGGAVGKCTPPKMKIGQLYLKNSLADISLLVFRHGFDMEKLVLHNDSIHYVYVNPSV